MQEYGSASVEETQARGMIFAEEASTLYSI